MSELSLAAQTCLDQVQDDSLSLPERRIKAATALRWSAQRLAAMDPSFTEACMAVVAELEEDDAPWLDCMDGFKASVEND